MKRLRYVVAGMGAVGLLAVGGVAAPAAAATYTVGARSCNSGYEAQTVVYHRFTATHGQFTGGSWSYSNINVGSVWSYSYDGYPSQSFASGTVSPFEVSSVVSSRCV